MRNNITEKIPHLRFLRWLTKVSRSAFDEMCDDVSFLVYHDLYSKPTKDFLTEDAKCSCSYPEQKLKSLKAILVLQGDHNREKIGMWIDRVDAATAGRESGILICGCTPGTGKSTVMNALSHIMGDHVESVFQVGYAGTFPFHGYSSRKVLVYVQ